VAYPQTTKTILTAADISRTVDRIAHQILEKTEGARDAVLLGIPTRGFPLARRLAVRIATFEDVSIPVGVLDVTLYRDDLRMRNRRVQAIPVVVGLRWHWRKGTQYDQLLPLQHAGMQELQQHALDLVGRFVDVFKKQDAAAYARKERRPQQRAGQRQVAAPQSAPHVARSTIGFELDCELITVDRGEKMVALKSVAQIVAVRFVSLDSFYVKYHSKAYDKNRGAWPSVVPRTSSVLAAQFLC